MFGKKKQCSIITREMAKTTHTILIFFLSFKTEVESDDDDALLQLRNKSSQDKEKEEEDYKQWAKKERKNLVNHTITCIAWR